MGHAEGLSASLELSGRQGPDKKLHRKPANLRGRCAVGFLIGFAVVGYGAMLYLGQAVLVP